MPVLTRNQSRLLKTCKENLSNCNDTFDSGFMIYQLCKNTFVRTMKSLLNACENTFGKQNKIVACTNVFALVNNELKFLVDTCNKYDSEKYSWNGFVIHVYNKCIEFREQYEKEKWSELNKTIVTTFLTELNKAHEYSKNVLLKFDSATFTDPVKQALLVKAQKHIHNACNKPIKKQEETQIMNKKQLQRYPKRSNIARVDYSKFY